MPGAGTYVPAPFVYTAAKTHIMKLIMTAKGGCSMKRHMIGLDIGTTAVKAVLFDTGGTYIDKETGEYPLHTPDAKTAEQDPDEILERTFETLRLLVTRNGCGAASNSFRSHPPCTA